MLYKQLLYSLNLFICVLLIIDSRAQAVDSTAVQIEDITITATRFPQKQSTTGKVVTILDKKDLRTYMGKSISEIISSQAGIFINGSNGTLGSNQEIYFRGAGVGNTLILLNGIPIGDPSQISNTFDLNGLSVAQVERIEIVKGAQSTTWGSNAMAGVINIITQNSNENTFSPHAFVGYGSYNTFKGHAGITGNQKKWNYQLQYNQTSSQGLSAAFDSTNTKKFDNDAFNQNNLQAQIRYSLTKNIKVSGFYSKAKYKTKLDAGAYADDRDSRVNTDHTNAQLNMIYDAEKLKFNISYANNYNYRNYIDDSTHIGGFSKFSRSFFKGSSSIAEIYGNYKFNKNWSWLSGIQFISQNTDQEFLSISSFGPFAFAIKDTAVIQTASFYNSIVLQKNNSISLEAGVRLNYHSIYGTNATFTLNPSLIINPGSRLFFNISSAYKIPSLYQLYSEYGNKNLKPESSITYESGVQFNNRNNSNFIRAVFFKRDFKKLIVFYTDAKWVSYYINRDKQNDYGAELESKLTIHKSIQWTSAASVVTGSGIEDQKKVRNLYRRPLFTFNTTIWYQPSTRFTIIPSYRYISKRLKGPFDPGPVKLPAYSIIDIAFHYQNSAKIRTVFEASNITNKNYFDAVGYTNKRFNVFVGIGYNL